MIGNTFKKFKGFLVCVCVLLIYDAKIWPTNSPKSKPPKSAEKIAPPGTWFECFNRRLLREMWLLTLGEWQEDSNSLFSLNFELNSSSLIDHHNERNFIGRNFSYHFSPIGNSKDIFSINKALQNCEATWELKFGMFLMKERIKMV